MKFDPPYIIAIDERIEKLCEETSFDMNKKDEGYISIDYNSFSDDPFKKDELFDLRLEMRGIKFCSKTGMILARPFHKFFNLNEKEYTQEENIDVLNILNVQNKLDGSMVHSCPLGYSYRLMTRSGITLQSEEAEKYLLPDHYKLFEYYRSYTFIFEYTSPSNRIVIPYNKPELTLLAARHNVNGKYIDLEIIKKHIKKYNLNISVIENIPIKSFTNLKNDADKNLKEGVVVTFFDGGRIKVKADWYIIAHRTKNILMTDWRVIEFILSPYYDDIFSSILDTDKEKISNFRSYMFHKLENFDFIAFNFFETFKDKTVSRKEYAESINKLNSLYPPFFISFLFKKIDDRELSIFKFLQIFLEKNPGHKKYETIVSAFDMKYSEFIKEINNG